MEQNGRIRLYLADDHPMYLEGLVRAVREIPDLELVGTSNDGKQALSDMSSLEPDVALLDMRMSGLSGSEILLAAKRAGLSTRIVFLSAYVESDLVYTAIAEGASGYLSKEADRKAIFEAVRQASRGEVVISPELQTAIADEIRRRESATRPLLSPREREILLLTAEGRSAPEIGRELHLSPATVKWHLQSLYEKLGVSDRAAAVAVALRKGLLE
jgi:two-component system nitrate/nitrite response regulator NarL